MRILRLILGALVLTVCTSGGCSHSGTKPSGEGVNLLENGSFEFGGKPSLAGWSDLDSFIVTIDADPAPGGGHYSLGIGTSWLPPTGLVWTEIPGIHEGDILVLSAFVRAPVSGEGGAIGIVVGPSPTWHLGSKGKWLTFRDTSWTAVSLVDTVASDPTQPVLLILEGPSCELCLSGSAHFDLVTLRRMEE